MIKYCFFLIWALCSNLVCTAQTYLIIHTQTQSLLQQNANQANYWGNSAMYENGWYSIYSNRNHFSPSFIDLKIHYTLLYKWEFKNAVCIVSVANYLYNKPELYMKQTKKLNDADLQWKVLGEVFISEDIMKLAKTWQQSFITTTLANKNSFIRDLQTLQCYAVSDDKPYKQLLQWLRLAIKEANGVDILQPLPQTPIITEFWDKKNNSFKIYNYKNNYK